MVDCAFTKQLSGHKLASTFRSRKRFRFVDFGVFLHLLEDVVVVYAVVVSLNTFNNLMLTLQILLFVFD